MRPLFKALIALVWLTVTSLALLGPAAAEEVIRAYSSDITLDLDGSVHVVETIRVRAEGYDIRRGIYRDIPTILINDDGSKLYSSLTINSVKRDGQEEPFHTEGITNGERIYIGDADVHLRVPAEYTYTIDYRMTRMARSFAEFDELYFNAIGPYWDFPMESAVASVTLPEGAAISDLQAYTGGYGSKDQAVAIVRDGQKAIFRVTKPLDAYEGLTVSVSFNKGVLTPPSASDAALNFLSDRRSDILPAFALMLVLFYNLWAWMKVGRDPARGTVIPLFYPPEAMSPARVHYIYRMGWRNGGWLAFTAGMIDLAVKGLLVLGKDNSKNTIQATADRPPAGLPPEEEALFNYFAGKGTVTVNKTTGPQLASQLLSFQKAAIGSDGNIWFRNNVGYIVGSVALSVLAVGIMFVAGVVDPVVLIVAIFASIMLTIAGTALGAGLRGNWITRAFIFAWLGFAIFNVGGAMASVLAEFWSYLNIDPALIAVLSILVINIFFGAIMRAPTPDGRAVMDKIEGFRMYLDTAEKERLNFAGEPRMTVSRFETILPYAIALGVEKPWTERFENDLARNAVSDYRGSGYNPSWHSGSNFKSGSMGRDIASFASGMSAAMIAAQPSSSSSSGSSGGGSSGGGGGGGGGGGW